MRERVPTAIRLTEEDAEVVRKLESLTGLEGLTAVFRLSIRETLAAWERKQSKKPKAGPPMTTKLAELNDLEIGILQTCMSYAAAGRLSPADSEEIRLDGARMGVLDQTTDLASSLVRLVGLGCLNQVDSTGGRYYTIAPGGRERVRLNEAEWKAKGAK